MIPSVILKSGRDGPIVAGHPWVFSGAIARTEGPLEPGGVVDVRSADGRFLARGYANPRCSITVRVLTRQPELIDGTFTGRRIEQAAALRAALIPPDVDAYRVVNGEGDFLPGLVIDRYGEFLVCQSLTAGADRLKSLAVAALVERLAPRGIFERSEGRVRSEEGLGSACGCLWGETPPDRLTIREGPLSYRVDLQAGQKTGFYLDQREHRALVRRLSGGRRVLDAFSYTGGFAVAAGLGGAANVVAVDASRPAMGLAHENWALNALPPERGEFVAADTLHYLRAERRSFDLVILDPPPFARRRGDVARALLGYKQINHHALRLLAPGGLLLTFSCSQHVGTGEFRRTVALAAAAAGREIRVARTLGQPADHPVLPAHPEGEYLRGLLCEGGEVVGGQVTLGSGG